MKSNIKNFGEVFTPPEIVERILDLANYKDNILDKHIMDNSAGDGAFLKEVVKRYIFTALKSKYSKIKIKAGLEKYVHAIEINEKNYKKLILNLNSISKENGIEGVKWDVEFNDALMVSRFDNKMDFVVGNPPYVRVHNLDSYDKVKSFEFTQGGMTDLYIAFFELGLKMLNASGKLCYISPSSWWTSVAGRKMREYIRLNQNLSNLINLGHNQFFKGITAYTCISLFQKNKIFKSILYKEYFDDKFERFDYKNVFIDDKMYFSKINGKLKKILSFNKSNEIKVKNGYATLNDKVFIKEYFDEGIEPLIKIIKGSTGKNYQCFYPYNENGSLIKFENLNDKTQKYLQTYLGVNGSNWFGFGRTQGLLDTYKQRISINSIISNKVESIKLNELKPGIGVYSGLYILTNKKYSEISDAIRNKFFIEYVSSLGKYKNGNSWTFSSNDLQKYLNFYFMNEEGLNYE